MKKIAFLAVIALFGLAATGYAQTNASYNLLDSPYKTEGEVSSLNESLICTALVLGGTGAMFAADLDCSITGGATVFITNELFAPFRVQRIDENCSIIVTWTTAFGTSLTMTGMAADVTVGCSTYWAVDPLGLAAFLEFNMGTGIPTGASAPLPVITGALWGPCAMDKHQPGQITAVQDIVTDVYVEVDLATGIPGASFPNPDNTGTGAYGNGASAAADISGGCSAHYSVTGGTITDGQVVRANQVDASVSCHGTWDFVVTQPSGEYFINGYVEFYSTVTVGQKWCLCIGNVTNLMFILDPGTLGIKDCQGIDAPASDVLYSNARQGGDGPYNVNIGVSDPGAHAIQKPPAGGPGKYLVHMNVGTPTGLTFDPLPAALGTFCFPLMIPPYGNNASVSIWNNIGKTNKVGASNYFFTPIADPPKAPAFYCLNPAGDPGNEPAGSVFCLQGIILNPASSSPKSASVTNAMTVTVTP
jgi:hypothetical protein